MGQELTSLLPLLAFFVLMFGAMYFFTIRPQRKRQKAQEELILSLKKGSRVITTGGIYGTVESVDDTTVTLKTESSATIRFSKMSVISLQN
ncbi:MAG: preprotein translocase subunit YajC [Dehalococcoidia bacterium]|nr:preprotein translocase subunit YajC [Dehalococcoidia bacterium]